MRLARSPWYPYYGLILRLVWLLPLSLMMKSDPSSKRQPSHQIMDGSSPNRSFLTRTFARRDDSGNFDSEYSKGPFGLNTLSEPPEPVVADLVFVHGLGGGSRSTWTKSLDPSLFWPEKWLPQDEGFKDVRIHTFGYNSNWGKESILNIHDFAKALLGSIHDCPAIPQGSKVSAVCPLLPLTLLAIARRSPALCSICSGPLFLAFWVLRY